MQSLSSGVVLMLVVGAGDGDDDAVNSGRPVSQRSLDPETDASVVVAERTKYS